MKPRLTQRIQFSLAYALVVVLLLSLLQSWLLAPRSVEIPYSKFLELLRADRIERVALTEREIRGVAKPGALPAPPALPGDRLRQWLGWAAQGAGWAVKGGIVIVAVCRVLADVSQFTGYNLRDVIHLLKAVQIQSEPRQAQREHVGTDTAIASANHSTVNATALIASAATHSTVNATEAHVNSCLSSCQRNLLLDLRPPPL